MQVALYVEVLDRQTMKRWIILLGPACVALGATTASAEITADAVPARAPNAAVTVGYVRGQGLGNVGVAAAYTLGSVEVGGAVFAQLSNNERGAALAPTLRLNFAHMGRTTATTHTSSTYVEASPQFVLTSFGGIAAKGWGLSATLGYELRFPNRIGVHLGLGLHSHTAVQGTDGIVQVKQIGEFSPHIDAGIRYRF